MASLSLSDKLNAFLAETREAVSLWERLSLRGRVEGGGLEIGGVV